MTDNPTNGTTPLPQQSPTRWRRALRSPWFHLFAAFLLLGLLQGFIVKLYAVPSGSMEQTLHTGDRILVDRLAYTLGAPAHGDVIVFTASHTWETPTPNTDSALETAIKWVGGLIGIGPGTEHTLVKRVIAVGGDTVECCDTAGRVLVNDEPLTEPYIHNNLPFAPGAADCATATVSPRCFAPYTVPDDQYFVLGDHRSNSADSAAGCRGRLDSNGCRIATVQRSDIVGRAAIIIWPLDRWGSIN